MLIFLLFALLLNPCVSAAPVQEFVIVVHKNRSVGELTSIDIKRMFLGKMKRWSDGMPVIPVFNPQSSTHEAFTRMLLQKSAFQLNTYWRKRLYSGQGMMPYQANDNAEVFTYLSEHPNAISYLPQSVVTDPLKMVKVIR